MYYKNRFWKLHKIRIGNSESVYILKKEVCLYEKNNLKSILREVQKVIGFEIEKNNFEKSFCIGILHQSKRK